MRTRNLRRFRRVAIALPAIIGVSALLAACSSTPGAGTSSGKSDPYSIVAIGGVTGALQQNAVAWSAGIKAAVSALNDNGGVDGHKVDITILDDKSDPTQAVTVLQQYLSGNPKPDLVIPGLISNESLGLVPILTRQKIVGISAVQNVTLDDPAKYPYFFSNTIKSQVTADASAEFLKSKGAKHVALVAPNDALLQSLQPALKAAFDKAGITMSVHSFDPDAIDTSAAFAEAKASGAQWIYADAVGATVPRLLDGRLKAGADSIPTIGGSSVSQGALLDVTTEAQRKNLYPILLPGTTYIAPADRSAAFSSLASKLGDLSKLPLPLNNYVVGWDNVAIWAAGVEQAKSADTVKVSSALENLKLSGKNSPERPWILWDTLWTNKEHFAQGKSDEVTIATVEGKQKDGMIVPASAN